MLECIPSGSLHDIIYKRGPVDAATARFYYANIACGLMFLNGHGLVHRDLKPTNILVKPDGYLALADFGLAKMESDTLKNSWVMVGTPIYMAPELIRIQSSIGRGIDWWSSGVILYEMVVKRMVRKRLLDPCGVLMEFYFLKPFYGKGEEETYKRVEVGKYKWPKHIRVGKSLKSFVAGLLTYECRQRLGVVGLVMEHPWLHGIDWDAMERHQYVVGNLFNT